MTLHLHLFGAPGVRAAGRPVGGSAAQPRRLAMLALLARAGDRGLTRDKIIGTLWPDVDEEKARRALTHALYGLRRDLAADDAIEGARDLRLSAERVTTDVAVFDRARAEGRPAEAVAVYSGPLMDGFHLPDAPEFERWLDTERSLLAAEYARMLEQLAAGASHAGDHRAAAAWWRRRTALDPLDGHLALELMRALVAAGDRAAALRHAEMFEVLLEQELGWPQDRAVAAYAAELRAAGRAGAPRLAVGRVVDFREEGAAAPLADLLASSLAHQPGVRVVAGAAAGVTATIDGGLHRLPDGRLRLELRRVDAASGTVQHAVRVEGEDPFALVDAAAAAIVAPGVVGRVT